MNALSALEAAARARLVEIEGDLLNVPARSQLESLRRSAARNYMRLSEARLGAALPPGNMALITASHSALCCIPDLSFVEFFGLKKEAGI